MSLLLLVASILKLKKSNCYNANNTLPTLTGEITQLYVCGIA